MSKQCLDISQMQHLKDLGLNTSNASMIYVEVDKEVVCVNKDVTYLLKGCEYGKVFVDAFTIQDILELLPEEIQQPEGDFFLSIDRKNDYWYARYNIYLKNGFYDLEEYAEDNLIDSLYWILCWCIGKEYIKTNKTK